MFEIYHEGDGELPEPLAEALAAVNRRDPAARYAVLRVATSEDSVAARREFHHDLAGALRTFRYLASKFEASLDPADPRREAKLSAIQHHSATLAKLIDDFVRKAIPHDD